MPDEALSIDIGDTYVNVSNGEPNVSIVLRTGQRVRATIGENQPAADTDIYVLGHGPTVHQYKNNNMVFSFHDLTTDTTLWVRSDEYITDQSIIVFRGKLKNQIV